MNNSIVLTLHKPQIIESVKNETFIRGSFDKAADQKATSLAYVEQAGDENYQNRLLLRSLSTSLEELKTNLSDYISANGSSSGDNIFLDEDDYMISITLVVGERFNHAYTESLARLSAKYIEETMLMDWWKPINEKQSSLYSKFVERDLAAIKRCFNKTAPTAPSYKYTTSLKVTGTSISIGLGGKHTVTYEISDGATDDIDVKVENPVLIGTSRGEDGFEITGLQKGETYIQLYSRHNPDLSRVLHVYIN